MKTKTKKTNIILRITEEEKEFIKLTATIKNFTSVSDYIRSSLIYPQRLDKKLSQDLIYEINKIGVNLNQVSRRNNKNNEVNIETRNGINNIYFQLEELVKIYKELLK